jgi:cysteine synthase B
LIFTDPTEGTDGAQRYVKDLVDQNPKRYFYPDQYNNDANWRAHYETTAMEIWRQTEGPGHALRRRPGHERHVHGRHAPAEGAEPADQVLQRATRRPAARARGHEAHGDGDRAGIYDPSIADEQLEVATEDAHRMVLRWRARKACSSASRRARTWSRR